MAAVPEPSIIHVDQDLVVLDKRPGLCVIPARQGDPRDCLRHEVEQALGARVFVVHRIDRETSGVVVMARTEAAHRALNARFLAREVWKEYRALVAGVPSADSGVIEVALARARKNRMRPADANEASLEARTEYRVLERHGVVPGLGTATALVAFEPRTGRQHQIRVHARALGCPILGDRLYAPQVVRQFAERLMLHARSLRFRHPQSGAEVSFSAPIPEDFESMRQRLAAL